MRSYLFFLFSFPLTSIAQNAIPKFKNDTLYTTSGFKMYKGQTLNFATGAGGEGSFRFVRLVTGGEKRILTHNSVVVKKLSKFHISGLGNGYIYVRGKVTYKDGSKGEIEFNMAFDRVIQNFNSFQAELIVPEEFKNKATTNVGEQIEKLHKLYKDSILTKDEFEIQKKKLLEN